MIIIGYQGIGKSTLSNTSCEFIDLESGNFWVDGTRDDRWYVPYCNIAEDISRQGYNVFVSSHAAVRKQLELSNEKVIAICPSIELREPWIAKLECRYINSKLDKDYKAWKNAEDRYSENIKEIFDDMPLHIELTNMDYDLYKEIWFFNLRNKKEE